jgi:translation initiation factor IF-2
MRPAKGIVIEVELDKGRGPVATVLVQKGTLKRGDIVSPARDRPRARDVRRERQAGREAGPSMPVEVLGLTARAATPATSSWC